MPSDLRPVTVILPSALLRLFAGSVPSVQLTVSTVDEAMDALDARWPGMRDRLCNSTPRIRKHINIFIDGERATLQSILPPGSELFIMTAISGG